MLNALKNDCAYSQHLVRVYAHQRSVDTIHYFTRHTDTDQH